MSSFVFRTVSICAGSFLVAGLASCASAPKCAFNYAQVKDSIIVPAMRAEIGEERTEVYDTDKPFYREERGWVSITFLYRNKHVIDGPVFHINFDPCSNRVLEAKETQLISTGIH